MVAALVLACSVAGEDAAQQSFNRSSWSTPADTAGAAVLSAHALGWQVRLAAGLHAAADSSQLRADAIQTALYAVRLNPDSCTARRALCDALELAE